MGKRLYVGNLSYRMTDVELEETFSQAGEVVEAVVMIDRETGRSRGFGFVEMATDEAAVAAIEQFNDVDVLGRMLKVAEAKPRPSRDSRDDY